MPNDEVEAGETNSEMGYPIPYFDRHEFYPAHHGSASFIGPRLTGLLTTFHSM